MAHSPKEQWLVDTFATVSADTELLRLPELRYQELTPKEKDKLRQTEVFPGETVQVLGKSGEFTLVRKYDATLGWMSSLNLQESLSKDFQLRFAEKLKPLDFLQHWLAVPYVWGGLSHQGIDCSGFTQMYYLQVHQQVLPKNSFDQRKLGQPTSLDHIKDHDLIFCYAHDEGATHHVVLYYQGHCWHARRKGGIVKQPLQEFVPQFRLEEVRTYLT